MRKTQLRITKTKVRRGKHWERYYCVIIPKLGGGRIRRFFKFTEEGKKEADTFLDISKTQQQNFGAAALSISDALRVEAIECVDLLKPFGKTLRDATKFYVKHLTRISGSKKVRDVIEELRAARSADGLSGRYLGDLRIRLAKFADVFGDHMIASLTAREIDEWLRSLPVGGVTRNSFRRRLATLFSFAKKRDYVSQNPMADVERAKERAGEIEILTVAETARLLECASTHMLPFWAIGAFAGLRRAEIERLEWSEIDFEDGLIEVKASKAKTATRRLVAMQPNLRKWLEPYRNLQGRACPLNLQRKINDDRERAGLRQDWPQNALRHSFGSYHLAAFNDAPKLALEMGNSPALLFKHYREIVKPKEAARYWNICPVDVENVIVKAA